MIDLIKDLPFEEFETCQCFEPSFNSTQLFGNNEVVVNEIVVTCQSRPICREIRRQMKKKEAETSGKAVSEQG